MKLQDAYSLLGIEPGCDGDDIRKAFRKQALIWHPDKNSNSDECTEMFQRIQTAYAKLTRELSGEYSCGEDSEDDDYYDEYDDEDDEDEDDCDYDCDCFFHGGIPPWEFFEQLFAAMESGQYNGYPPGFPFHEGGFPFPRSSGGGSRGGGSAGQGGQPQQQHDHHCPHHPHHHDAEADAYYDHTYAYESREERRHREREEQKLEKMWRKEMEMAERENIRAANAAKAAKSLAQQRNVTAWMRQMPRPTMASRDDTSIELVLVRKGVATDELPNTCVGKLETRKNGESSWAQRIVDKDTSKVKVDNLEPGTSYYFRVCSGQHHPDGNEEWGEWSVESRYATPGKAPSVAAQHDSAPDRGRKAKHNVAPRASKASVGNGGGNNHGHSEAHDGNGAAEAEEDRLRKEEKERAIQKALEAAAADYEETQKSFMPADSGASGGANKKKKKKKNKGKAAADPANDNVAAAAAPQGFGGGNSAPPQPRQAPYQPPLKVVEDVRNLTPQELEAAENEELARALEESLSMYNDTVAAKEAVAHALGPPEKQQQQWATVPKPQVAPRGAPGPHLWAPQQQQHQPSRGAAVKPPGAAASVIQQLPKPVPSSMVQPQAAVGRKQPPPPHLNGKTTQPPPPPPPQQQQQLQQQHVRSPTICKFFNSEQGCKWGLNCKFQHLDQGANGGPKGPFSKVGSVNGNGIRQQQDGAAGLQQAPVCSHFASGQGCRYGSQCKFLHELPQQQQQQQQPKAPDASSLPSTLFPDTPGPFAPPPPPPPPMQQGAPATSLPVPQPIGTQQQQQSNPFGFSGGPELPVPLPVPSKQQQQLGGLRTGLPQPFPVSHGFHSLGGPSMQQQQLNNPQPLDDHRPLATLFPATSSLSDPTDASAAASALFPDHTGPGTGAGSFLGLAAASGAAPGWGTTGSGAGGFPGFGMVDFGMSQLGAVGKHGLGPDLGEPQELPQEEHIAALDAEAFLNSISMGPDDAQQHMPAPEAAPGPLQGAYRGASAAPVRPRYNPVGSYNPLAPRGPP